MTCVALFKEGYWSVNDLGISTVDHRDAKTIMLPTSKPVPHKHLNSRVELLQVSGRYDFSYMRIVNEDLTEDFEGARTLLGNLLGPELLSAIGNGEKGRVDYGFTIVGMLVDTPVVNGQFVNQYFSSQA